MKLLKKRFEFVRIFLFGKAEEGWNPLCVSPDDNAGKRKKPCKGVLGFKWFYYKALSQTMPCLSCIFVKQIACLKKPRNKIVPWLFLQSAYFAPLISKPNACAVSFYKKQPANGNCNAESSGVEHP